MGRLWDGRRSNDAGTSRNSMLRFVFGEPTLRHIASAGNPMEARHGSHAHFVNVCF